MSGWTFTTAKKCLWKANITERGSTCWPSTSHRRLVLCHLVSSISVLPTTSRHLSSGDRSAFRLVLFTADHETEELVQIVTKHVRVYLQGLRVSVVFSCRDLMDASMHRLPTSADISLKSEVSHSTSSQYGTVCLSSALRDSSL